MTEEILLFYVPCPNFETATSLGESLVQSNLAACFNCSNVEGGYIWKKEFCTEKETVLVIKTAISMENKIRNFIEDNHPYDLPCVAHWKITVNKGYADWVKEQVEHYV